MFPGRLQAGSKYVKEIPSERNLLSVFCFQHSLFHYELCRPMPVAARSTAWVCRRWLAGNGDLNPAGDMGICLLRMLYVVRQRSVRWADSPTSAVCLSVIMKPREWRGPGPLGAVVPQNEFKNNTATIYTPYVLLQLKFASADRDSKSTQYFPRDNSP
jgi:hypothetical protein